MVVERSIKLAVRWGQVAAVTTPAPSVILIYRSRDRSFIVIRGGGWSFARTEGGSRAKGKRSIDLRMPIGPCGIFTSVRGPSLIVFSNRLRLTRPEQRRLIHTLRLVLCKCDFLRFIINVKIIFCSLHVSYENST